MKCLDLFENIKVQWPNIIELNDSTHDQLNTIYWNLESKIDHETDHWLSLSSWAFHQAICAYAKQQIVLGHKVFSSSEMPLNIFNRQMLFNLDDDDWKKERGEYEQS